MIFLDSLIFVYLKTLYVFEFVLCLYSHLYLYLWLKLGGAGPVLIHDYQINPFCRGGAQPGMLHRHLLERRLVTSECYRVLQRGGLVTSHL